MYVQWVHLSVLASWARLLARFISILKAYRLTSTTGRFLFQRLKARYCWRRHRWQVELAREPSAFDQRLPRGKAFPMVIGQMLAEDESIYQWSFWDSIDRMVKWSYQFKASWRMIIPHGSIYQWSRYIWWCRSHLTIFGRMRPLPRVRERRL